MVKFDPGVILYVNGTLNIDGESGDDVTLTRSGTSGTWDGIQINYGGSGAINYATIDYANRGIYAYSPSSLTVQNAETQRTRKNAKF